jgi:hypothetical protein
VPGVAFGEDLGDAYGRPDQEDDGADDQQEPCGLIGVQVVAGGA